jgi:uncharacterized protein (DUF924 family)
MQQRLNELLDFWFGADQSSCDQHHALLPLWLGETLAKDSEIVQRFEPLLQQVAENDVSVYADSPKGSLSMILLYHQVPRHSYRGLSAAFAFDDRALNLCLNGLSKGFDHQLSLIERVFYYMPLQHAEDLYCQQSSVNAYYQLLQIAFPESRDLYQTFYSHAVTNYRMIQTFSRFPHRNQILNRPSTHEELQFLKLNGLA